MSEPAKRKPVRHVFGRRKFLRDGAWFTVEMRWDHLLVRRRYQRRGLIIPFKALPVEPDGQISLL